MFCVTIYVWCRIKPLAGPSGEKSPWRPRLTSLKAGGPVAFLFIVVIGGIYLGIFTPTEGGAIGALGSFVIGLVMRRYTRKNFAQSLLETGKTASMVFLILIGGLMFTRFAAWCNLSGTVSNFIHMLALSPIGYTLVAIIMLFILGCFMDIMPIILIGIPILHPIAVALGINPIWFAILACVTINLGALTPPVGINLFVLKGLNKEISMTTIYAGSIPFVLGTLATIIILFAVPSLVTWLPSIMK
jgi:C4-dicarboxylate transporter, DctM subunit